MYDFVGMSPVVTHFVFRPLDPVSIDMCHCPVPSGIHSAMTTE